MLPIVSIGGSTDHTVYIGNLAHVSSMTFSSQVCAVGVSGAATFQLGSGNQFWVIVGNDGAKEESYDRSQESLSVSGRERRHGHAHGPLASRPWG